MKLQAPKNENYAATVVRIRHINQLAGCDNVVGVSLLGYQAIVSKDVQVGDLGVAFTAETQLDHEFASNNNLYRHSDLNVDPDAKGYLEDNRRVRAIKFRGHRSDALFMSLASLAYAGVDVSKFNEGDTFDELNGHAICHKYVVRTTRPGRDNRGSRPSSPRVVRVDEAQLPKHFDTANYFRNADQFATGEEVTITQKLHGTSVRIGHTLVRRKLTWLERLAKRIGVQVRETEYAYVYGSRNVIKDPDNPFEAGEFYGTDIYTKVGSWLKGLLPKGYVVYGEIVGWASDDTPIQSGYMYKIPRGKAELFVYRVTRVGEDGFASDLSWLQVKDFCRNIGVPTVPELWAGYGIHLTDEFVQSFLDKRFADTPGACRNGHALPTDDGRVDEGICIRKEGLFPVVLKAKSPKFLEHETKLLDKGVADIESAEPELVDA